MASGELGAIELGHIPFHVVVVGEHRLLLPVFIRNHRILSFHQQSLPLLGELLLALRLLLVLLLYLLASKLLYLLLQWDHLLLNGLMNRIRVTILVNGRHHLINDLLNRDTIRLFSNLRDQGELLFRRSLCRTQLHVLVHQVVDGLKHRQPMSLLSILFPLSSSINDRRELLCSFGVLASHALVTRNKPSLGLWFEFLETFTLFQRKVLGRFNRTLLLLLLLACTDLLARLLLASRRRCTIISGAITIPVTIRLRQLLCKGIRCGACLFVRLIPQSRNRSNSLPLVLPIIP